MKIPVLVIPVEKDRFEARAGEPFRTSAEGQTRDEAMGKLQAQIAESITSGAEVREIDVPTGTNPWLGVVGMYQNGPLFDEWQQAIAENRRQIDTDPDAP